MHQLVTELLAGSTRAAARLARAVDDQLTGYESLLQEIFPHTGRARVIGVTGNPGSGKSTLVDRLIERFRTRGKVGVVAVDPSSPFSSGAILGDRIRMQRHFGDTGVFIRSLATRGALGGLSRSAADVTRVLDAWGAQVVLLETVGVGQDEVDVSRLAESNVVLATPGLGDDIQAIKAGILECADIFVVNKADREGADVAVSQLESMLALGPGARDVQRGHSAAARITGHSADDAARWRPPVLKCVATRDTGVDALVQALDAHRAWLEQSGEGPRREQARLEYELASQLSATLVNAALTELGAEIRRAAVEVQARRSDPYRARQALAAAFRQKP